jgi:hypothetical protein
LRKASVVWRGWRFAEGAVSSLDLGQRWFGLEVEAGTEIGLVRLRMLAASASWAACCGIDGHWTVHYTDSSDMAIPGCGLDERAWVASTKYETDGDV